MMLLTVTSGPDQAAGISDLVASLAKDAACTYSLGGTYKFELPAEAVDLAQVFDVLDGAKYSDPVQVLDWGISHASLEEVFRNVSEEADICHHSQAA